MEIQMYGIAIAIKKPREAKLFYLNVNLETKKCCFRRSLEFFDSEHSCGYAEGESLYYTKWWVL